MITAAVDTAVGESPDLKSDQENIVHSLLKLLELNSNWVELYEITGELHFPPDDADRGHLQESIQQIKEVRA